LSESPLLDVKDLKIKFTTDRAKILAVDGINFTLNRGETLGLVGESGCGKSVSALAVMGLLPSHAGGGAGLAQVEKK